MPKRPVRCGSPLEGSQQKNCYEIHFAPSLWKAIKPLVENIQRLAKTKRLYWISPTRRVKQFEKDLSTWFALYLPDFKDSPMCIEIQVNQKNDVDNIPGAILDALQKSRRIVNDRQVESITIRRSADIKEPIIIITPLSSLEMAA